MDRETLEREAARFGYRLIEKVRIKAFKLDFKRSEFVPDEYIDHYIRHAVVEELYNKMEEFKKIGKYIQRWNKNELYFEITFDLEVIVPHAPTRRRTTRESNPLSI